MVRTTRGCSEVDHRLCVVRTTRGCSEVDHRLGVVRMTRGFSLRWTEEGNTNCSLAAENSSNPISPIERVNLLLDLRRLRVLQCVCRCVCVSVCV